LDGITDPPATKTTELIAQVVGSVVGGVVGGVVGVVGEVGGGVVGVVGEVGGGVVGVVGEVVGGVVGGVVGDAVVLNWTPSPLITTKFEPKADTESARTWLSIDVSRTARGKVKG